MTAKESGKAGTTRISAPETDWADVNGLRAATVGNRDARRKVLIFMGLRACVEPFELQRFTLLAGEWNAQLTVVDTPGCGCGGARLTHKERGALRRGDFTPVARRMVLAAAEHNGQLLRRPVTVVGYSLGTSVAAAAAADPGLVRVREMITVEPVAMRRCNPLRLMRTARVEDSTIDEYLADNEAYPDAVAPPDHRGEAVPRSRTDLAHLGYALSRGHLTRDLLRANRVQRFPLQIVHGTNSMLTNADDTARLTATCRRAGMEVYDIPVEGGHALWQSLPGVAAVAQVTRQRWT